MEKINFSRLAFARERRQMSKKSLADSLNITDRALRNYESSESSKEMPPELIWKVSSVLGYPRDFFFGEDIESIDGTTVSFRAVSSAPSAQKKSAIAAGSIACIFNDWAELHFNLPKVNVPKVDLSYSQTPESSSIIVRNEWGIGQKSISNVVHLLEKNGVRVFSLSENNLNINAYSFWKDNVPFIFLNNNKSPECQRFDACHELGHLVMHCHGGAPTGREAELQANRFSSAFLMPEGSIRTHSYQDPNLQLLISLKHNWQVSLAALVRRLSDLGLLSEWLYTKLSQQMGMRGYFKKEPNQIIEREKSKIIQFILNSLMEDRKTINHLEAELNLPLDELSQLLFGPTIPQSKKLRNPSSKIKLTLA